VLDGNDPLVALAQIRRTPDGRTIVDMTRSRAGLALFGLLGLALFAAVAAVAIPAVVARTRDPYYAARPWYFWPFALFNRATHEPPLSFTDKTVPVDELLDELGRHWQSSGAGVVEVEPTGAD